MKRSRLLLLIVAGLLGLCLCAIVGAALVQRPDAAGPATAGPMPTAEPATFGASRAAWEAAHKPSGHVGTFYQYDAGRFDVAFRADRVWHLERSFGPAPVTLQAARGEAAGFLPADAQRVKTYSPAGRPELTVDVYTSAGLAQRVSAADWWNGAAPGTFIAIFGVYDGQVPRWILAAGNQP